MQPLTVLFSVRPGYMTLYIYLTTAIHSCNIFTSGSITHIAFIMGTNGTHLICPYCARYQFHNWWMTVGWMGVPCRLVSKVGFKLMFDSLDSRSFQCKPLQLTWLFMHFQHTGIVWGQETGIRPGMGKGVSMHWQDHEFAQIWLKLTMYIYIYIYVEGPIFNIAISGNRNKWLQQTTCFKMNVHLPNKCFEKCGKCASAKNEVLQKGVTYASTK